MDVGGGSSCIVHLSSACCATSRAVYSLILAQRGLRGFSCRGRVGSGPEGLGQRGAGACCCCASSECGGRRGGCSFQPPLPNTTRRSALAMRLHATAGDSRATVTRYYTGWYCAVLQQHTLSSQCTSRIWYGSRQNLAMASVLVSWRPGSTPTCAAQHSMAQHISTLHHNTAGLETS